MRGERQLLHLGEYLVGRACRQLPHDVREEQYQEWAAELPAILHDPQVRFASLRAVRMLAFAADTLRGTIMTPGTARAQIPRLCADVLLPVTGLVVVALSVLAIVLAPGNGLNYLRLACGLLIVAFHICRRARGAGRATTLLGISAILAGGAVLLGVVAQAPGDWVNYILAAVTFLPGILLALWLRRLQARTGGRHAASSDP